MSKGIDLKAIAIGGANQWDLKASTFQQGSDLWAYAGGAPNQWDLVGGGPGLISTVASSSGNLFQLAVASSAAIAESVAVARALKDAITSIASVADALAVKRALADAISSTATVADALRVTRAFADVIAAQGSVGNMSMAVKRAFIDAIAGSASLATMSMAVKRALADAILGHASLADAIIVQRKFADAISSSASVAEALAVKRALADVITAQGSVADAMRVARHFIDAIAAQGSIVDTLAVKRALILGIVSSATMIDAVDVVAGAKLFAMAIAASASVATMSLVRQCHISAGIIAQGVCAEVLRIARPLTTGVQGTGSVTANERVLRAFRDAFVAAALFQCRLAGGPVFFSTTIAGQAEHDYGQWLVERVSKVSVKAARALALEASSNTKGELNGDTSSSHDGRNPTSSAWNRLLAASTNTRISGSSKRK